MWSHVLWMQMKSLCSPLGCWFLFHFPTQTENWGLLLCLWVYPEINKPMFYSILYYCGTLFACQQIGAQYGLNPCSCRALPRPPWPSPTPCSWTTTLQLNYPSGQLCQAWLSSLTMAIWKFFTCPQQCGLVLPTATWKGLKKNFFYFMATR